MTFIFKIGHSFLKHKNMQNYGNVMNIYVFLNDSYMSYEMVCSILNELKLILTFGYMLTISVTFRRVTLNVTWQLRAITYLYHLSFPIVSMELIFCSVFLQNLLFNCYFRYHLHLSHYSCHSTLSHYSPAVGILIANLHRGTKLTEIQFR